MKKRLLALPLAALLALAPGWAEAKQGRGGKSRAHGHSAATHGHSAARHGHSGRMHAAGRRVH